MTHVNRSIQSHDLSEEEINSGSQTFFWPHKDMEGLPGWGISSIPGQPPRQHKHERRYTLSAHQLILTRRTWKDGYDGQIIFGHLLGLKLPNICLTGEEKPEKTSPWKLVPTGDWTRVRCVTGAHAAACSTAVDLCIFIYFIYLFIYLFNLAELRSSGFLFHSARKKQ